MQRFEADRSALALMQPFLSLKKLTLLATSSPRSSILRSTTLHTITCSACTYSSLLPLIASLVDSSTSSTAMASSHAATAVTGCVDTNTTFVQADPTTFRALVQKLTGAPGSNRPAGEKTMQGGGVAQQPALVRRPKLQERRRAGPARLELARPQPLYYNHHHHRLMHSPVSPMDYAYVMASSSSSSLSSSSSSLSPSPPASSSSCGVVITKEEEEREEKAIASKGFYLHSSPRSGAGDSERPKLLPLFPVHSPRSSSFARS
ncbi:hypothetical protein E2562_004242 [Oryza meyeriana var. granulata]|uniref:VQ domain-containing protein n=1 Tax=Oryza meyeriana var. granulata TaxID=110450 RepID=A0A6G1BRX0_9ORYZ|nr:hypothetical protein E2562_004242 [Oryza meyeriana var. granulata]